MLHKGLLCLRAQTPLRLRTARACVILRSSTVRPTCPATAAPPGASRTTRHTVTATVVAGGKHIVLVDGVKTALDKLGEVIGHRGEKEMGPVGLPQALRVRGLAHAVLCLECLVEKGPTALILDERGVVATHGSDGRLHAPFVQLSKGRTSAFCTHRECHTYAAYRDLRKRSRRGSRGLNHFSVGPNVTRWAFALARCH